MDLQDLLNTPLKDMRLRTHTYFCLLNSGYATAGDVASLSEQQILAIKGAGRVTLREIKTSLRRLGLKLDNQLRSERIIKDRMIREDELAQLLSHVRAGGKPAPLSVLLAILDAPR
jgi:hypothetical protein